MVEKTFIVKNKLGLHARPAALLVQTASKFKSKIMVQKGDTEVNGKSVMGLMMLAAECGSTLKISFDGADAQAAIAAVAALFERKFDED